MASCLNGIESRPHSRLNVFDLLVTTRSEGTTQPFPLLQCGLNRQHFRALIACHRLERGFAKPTPCIQRKSAETGLAKPGHPNRTQVLGHKKGKNIAPSSAVSEKHIYAWCRLTRCYFSFFFETPWN